MGRLHKQPVTNTATAPTASALLSGQRPHELRRPPDPHIQLIVVLYAFRLDRHPISHRPAGDVERPDVRLPLRRLPLVGAEAGDEPVLPGPDQGVAVEEEADAPEHLLLLDTLRPGQGVPDAGGKSFIKGHRAYSFGCPGSSHGP